MPQTGIRNQGLEAIVACQRGSVGEFEVGLFMDRIAAARLNAVQARDDLLGRPGSFGHFIIEQLQRFEPDLHR